jgi:hypothetical protein
MIEQLEGFPDNVVAMAARGHVTRSDYERVLIPRVQQALGRHAKIRCYYEITGNAGFDAGAVWEDLKIGLEHLVHWERVAVVTDVNWIRKRRMRSASWSPARFRCLARGKPARRGPGSVRHERRDGHSPE